MGGVGQRLKAKYADDGAGDKEDQDERKAETEPVADLEVIEFHVQAALYVEGQHRTRQADASGAKKTGRIVGQFISLWK
jgi:hypothetical protein